MSILSVSLFAQNYNWSPSGLPFHSAHVWDCEYFESQGTLYASGAFLDQDTTLGTNDWYDLAIYDGSEWEYDDDFNQLVGQITIFEDNVLITGLFSEHHGIQSKIYQPFGETIFPNMVTVPEISSMWLKVTNDTLFALGGFEEINGVTYNGLAKWNGSGWETVPPFDTFSEAPQIANIEFYDGEYYVCGNYSDPEFGPAKLSVIRNGELEQVGQGILGVSSVGQLAVFQDELIIAGRFYKNAGNPGNMIMKWNGEELLSIGADLLDGNGGYNFNAQVYDMEIIHDRIFIGGVFTYAGGIFSLGHVIWDGEKFCALGGVSTNAAMCFTPMGDTIVVGGILYNDDVLLNKLAFYTGSSNICSTVDVPELGEDGISFSLHPNPASDILHLNTDDQHGIEIIRIVNLLGKEIYSKNLMGKKYQSVEIDVNSWSDGIYLVTVNSNRGIRTLRFVKN